MCVCARQDSVVALQALAKYGEEDTNRALYNVRIEMSATASRGYNRDLEFDRSNWQDLQYFEVGTGRTCSTSRYELAGPAVL